MILSRRKPTGLRRLFAKMPAKLTAQSARVSRGKRFVSMEQMGENHGKVYHCPGSGYDKLQMYFI
jgi:hypothetical protein